MKKQFTFHEDGSHGWLEVSYKDVTDVDIHNEISEFLQFAISVAKILNSRENANF